MFSATIFLNGQKLGTTAAEDPDTLDDRIDDLLYVLDLEHDKPGVEILIDQL